MSEKETWVDAAEHGAVKPGEVVGVVIGGLDIALYNIDGQVYATHNLCTHAEARLSEGWLDHDVIECPFHGGRFEVKTGKGLGPPIMCDLATLPVRIDGPTIQVRIDGRPSTERP